MPTRLAQAEERIRQRQTELALLRMGTQTQVRCGEAHVLEAVTG